MTVDTRTFDALKHAITSIAGLEDKDHTEILTKTGIAKIDDLAFLKFEDLQAALPSAQIFKLRILESISSFISMGETITSGTDKATILTTVNSASSSKTVPSSPSRTVRVINAPLVPEGVDAPAAGGTYKVDIETSHMSNSLTDPKEEEVKVKNFFLIKHITENSDGDLSVIGTFVQSNFNLEGNFFFKYRINDITADENNGWVTDRNENIINDIGRKTFQVNAPLEIETRYDNFPFKTVCASIMIELSSSSFYDKSKKYRPSLLLHKSKKGQNVALQKLIKMDCTNETEKEEVFMKEYMKKMDKSITYDFINPYPEVTYIHEKKGIGYCSKFKVSFYMVESGIPKLIEIVFPMFLIALLNTLNVLGGNKVDTASFLGIASTLALAAVVILPSIVTKRKSQCSWNLNNLYIIAIFIGLSLSSIPEKIIVINTTARVGMIITWLSFLAPFCGCIGYFRHRRDIMKKAPKLDDRISTGKDDKIEELIEVKFAVPQEITPNAYKYEDYADIIEVYS